MTAIHVFNRDGLAARIDELNAAGLIDFDEPTGTGPAWVPSGLGVSLVWPAAPNGVLEAPPMQHLLDQLVHEALEDACSDIHVEMAMYPEVVTMAVVPELPPCDYCLRAGDLRSARYDTRCEIGWAYVCTDHYWAHADGRLGVNLGQYLILDTEIPDDVHAAFRRAIEYWKAWKPDSQCQ